jgi:hypothetical protein
MQQSLDALAKGFGTHTSKGFVNFAAGEIFDPTNPEHLQYLRDDCISLYQVITKYREIINKEFKTDPKLTAASTAYNCWATMLPEGKRIWKHGKLVSEFCRKAYFGGRTECLYQGTVENVTCIDVNSLYAYIMREVGGLHKPFYTTSLQARDGHILPGFYRVRCTVPVSLKFGPLPCRKRDGAGTIFPVGKFITHASSVEIEFAIELGCQIEVIEGYAFDEWDKDLFKPFIEECIHIRSKDYNGAYGQTAKFLQNNLYGYFGMKAERDEVIVCDELPDEEGFDPVCDTHTGEVLPGLWSKKTVQETVNQIPAFAAWITANARVHLLRAAYEEENAGNTVFYCDTDSLFMRGVPVSKIADGEYGAFKVEWKNATFYGVSGKAYMYVLKNVKEYGYCYQLTDEEISKLRGRGKMFDLEGNLWHMKHKGLPARVLTPELFNTAEGGIAKIATEIEIPTLNRLFVQLKTGERGNEFARRSSCTVKSISNRVPGDGYGATTPIVLEEF